MQDVRLLSLYWAVVWVCSLSCYSWRIPSELFGAYRDRSVHPAVNDQIKIQRFVFSIVFSFLFFQVIYSFGKVQRFCGRLFN